MLLHLKAITDPVQFAYRANKSVGIAVNLALHYILQHLDSTRTYARILFQALLQEKPSQLSVPDSSCRWITDFLSDRKQHVKLGKNVSDSQTISTGSPQGCVLSPLLYYLYTYNGHVWWWWVCLQMGDWQSGDLEQTEQPRSQWPKDSGDGCGLQEELSLHHPLWLHNRRSGVFSLPGNYHLPGPHQESPADDVLPAAAEENKPAKDNDGALLHRHHQVHPHLFYHHLVRCCHYQGQGQTAAYHLICWESDQLQSSIPPGPVH